MLPVSKRYFKYKYPHEREMVNINWTVIEEYFVLLVGCEVA